MNLLTSATKYVYDILIINKYVRPTALDRWQGIYCIEGNGWSNIFKQCYFCTRETKLQSLQYKLTIRSCTNGNNSSSCEMCKEGKVDDLTHHFIESNDLNNF